MSKSDAKSSRYERNFIHPRLEIIVKLQFNIEPLHREIASEVFAARKYWLFKLSESLGTSESHFRHGILLASMKIAYHHVGGTVKVKVSYNI